MRPRPTRMRLMLTATSRCARAVFAVLACVGFFVGVARHAVPRLSHAALPTATSEVGDASSVDAAVDDTAPVLSDARLPASGIRRAVVIPPPGLTDHAALLALAAAASVVRPLRDVLAPPSFVPSPPFHPPRAV